MPEHGAGGIDAKRNGGSDFSKPPLHRRVEMCLLYDGFFSFAVVRQAAMPEHGAGGIDAKRNGGSDFSKPPLHRRVEMCLLYDGFFSFAVVRQDVIQYSIQCFQ